MSKRNSFLGALSSLAVLADCWLLHRPQPQRNGIVHIHGLNAPVEILRDKWDIPHVYAQNLDDLFFAQGFLHAQERLFQMDFQRRLVAGRLSEILGEVALPLDRWMRTLTLYHRAEQEAQTMTGDYFKMITSFVAGVNAFIASGKLPMEMKLLNYQPEEWKTADPLAWAKMMAWDLSVNWETEIIRAQLVKVLGLEKEASLEPPYPAAWSQIIPPEEDYSCIGNAALRRAEAARPFTGPPARQGLGSNNWVLSGDRTTTGKPLLANDMHLGMGIPSLWIENHLVAGEFNLSGISFTGIPGVMQGHNPWVAWGFTMGFSDSQDLYIEHLRTAGDGRMQYEFRGEWLDAEVLQEVIRVKDKDPVIETVVITRHGPVINLLSPELTGEAPLALGWTALHDDAPLAALYYMNTARNCQEFRESLRGWTAPSQNIVYADTLGNIGYSMAGYVPIRTQGDGRMPVPGWSGEYEWSGYIPFEDLPHMWNPKRGYIATANNKIVDDAYPYWMGNEYCTGARFQRIQEMIEGQEKNSVEDICRMQVDQVSTSARTISKVLAALSTDKEEIKPLLVRFSQWDGNLAATSPEAAIYETFIHFLMHRLLKPVLGDLTEHYIGKGPTPVIKAGSLMGHQARAWLLTILEDPASPWWSENKGATREDQIIAALLEAADYLKQKCGPSIDDWQWGKIHQITFSHSLGSVKPLDALVNRGPYPMGGDIDTVWMGHSSHYELGGHHFSGPQFRFIGDVDNWNNSRGMIVPGQSGHPASKHYSNSIQDWLHGRYHPMLFDREEVLKAVDATLHLIP